MDFPAHLPRLRAFARALTRDHTQADDLVQDTVVKAMENIDRFTPGTNEIAWLQTIMKNLFLDGRRAARVRHPHVDMDSVEGTLLDRPRQGDRMEFEAVITSVAKLPNDQRGAILMVANGATYEDVAAHFAIPPGTVRSRIARGRRTLREMAAA